MSLELFFKVLSMVAATSAVIKIIILAQVATRNSLTSSFNLVAVSMIAYNVTESITWWIYHSNPGLAAVTFDLIMYSIIAIGYSMVSFVVEVTEASRPREYRLGFAIFGAGVAVLYALGYVSEGTQQVGYSVVTIKGPLYPAFSAFMLSMIFVSLLLLIKGRKHKKYVVQLRSKLTLVATSLFFSTAFLIMGLQFLGYNASSGGVLPVATCAFLLLLMYGEKGDEAIITFSMKWIRVWFYFGLTFDALVSRDKPRLDSLVSGIEKKAVIAAMKKCNNNKTKAARLLDTSPTKLNRVLAKIKEKEVKRNLALKNLSNNQ